MDCKRLNKYRALRLLKPVAQTLEGFCSLLLVLSLTACTWVKDDRDNCPYGFWLQLDFSYNMLDVDAAAKYVNDACVYIYRDDGTFVRRLNLTQSELLANGHKVRIEGLDEGDYQFLVWSGIGNSEYAVSGDAQTIDDFRLSLAATGDVSAPLPPLYHGYLPAVHFDDTYAVHNIDLMKNTNEMACLVVSMDKNAVLDANDYSLSVVANNNTMDARNRLIGDETTTYLPFENDYVTLHDDDYGDLQALRFNLMTMRLTDKNDCRIILKENGTGTEVFNISLQQYVGQIGTLYNSNGRQMTVQEYLDRQDFFTIVFFLSADKAQLVQVMVNTWRIRAYNHIKL